MTSNPLKRARSSSPGPISHSSPVRDPEYYDEDGNCIIRVENVLFKALKTHHVFLTRESEVLADMFKLPQGHLPAEGTTDENAIVLPQGDAPQFRAFLRYTLASRLDTQVDHIPNAAAEAVLDLGHFASKYMMTSWLEWSVSVIKYLCKSPLNPGLSVDVLRPALLLAKNAPKASELWDTIPDLWKLRLQQTRSLPKYSDALDAAEAAGHRTFLVDIYYLILSARRGYKGPSRTATSQQFPYHGLAPIHIQRLFAGSWSLTMLWQQLMNHPPEYRLPQHWDCAKHARCTTQWKQIWREGLRSTDMDAHNPADVIGRIDSAEKTICETDRLGIGPKVMYTCYPDPGESV
ncbi:hypothetical protein FB45DRAFT_1009103 [Roridomyces roridus]|uniref:BTB domain-containing protein n=1 Tax=Roridomyces roridus TaxID=1738132 RepID=A0AAD7FAY7_9AGAR|nr:hypothetical protein FB45DRAFT_1009103 [Roridomyces roridus]